MIRRAEEKDIPRIMDLLSQVLEIHAALRPDLFIPGTRKYTEEQLKELIADDQRPVYVWTDENGTVMGYAFCIMHEPIESPNMVPHRMLYIDDLFKPTYDDFGKPRSPTAADIKLAFEIINYRYVNQKTTIISHHFYH